MKSLIKKHADIELKDNEGNIQIYRFFQHIIILLGITPLIYASSSGNFEMEKLLIENGANPNVKNIDGNY